MVATEDYELPQEEVNQEINQNAANEQYNLINRVVSYPAVSSLWGNVKGYYSVAKEKSNLVKKASGVVESNIESTMKYIIQPVIENDLVKKYSEPMLTKVDGLGCKSLDKLEQLSETYQPTVTAFAEDIKTKVSAIAETSAQAVEPLDQYLKTSYLAKPLNMAVDISENLCDKYLPTEGEKEPEEEELKVKGKSTAPIPSPQQERGPLYRGTKVAKRLQKEAFAKLQNLNLRDLETMNSYHVVDLIQYAAHNLEASTKSTSKFIGETFNKGVELSKEAYENPKKIMENPKIIETKDKVQHISQDVIEALHSAVHILSAQIPEPISNTTTQILEQSKKVAVVLSDANASFYSALAIKSAEKLRETGNMISASLQENSQIPLAILESARQSITSILESFSPVHVDTTPNNTVVAPVSIN